MQEFLIQNFFGIICCIAAFGISYILKNINTNISELQKEYKQLVSSREETRIKFMQDITAIKELIAGEYVRRKDVQLLIENEILRQKKKEQV